MIVFVTRVAVSSVVAVSSAVVAPGAADGYALTEVGQAVYVSPPLREVFLSSTPSEALRAAAEPPTHAPADMLTSRMQKLALETQTPNWNDESDEAIPQEAWQNAERFIRKAMESQPGTSPPFVSPCGDGSIHSTWKRADGGRLTMELKGDRAAWRLRVPGNVTASGAALTHDQALEAVGSFLRG